MPVYGGGDAGPRDSIGGAAWLAGCFLIGPEPASPPPITTLGRPLTAGWELRTYTMSRTKRFGVATVLSGVLALVPVTVLARSATQRYLLVAECPERGVAANGGTIHITCAAGERLCGTFSVHPKSIDARNRVAHRHRMSKT
jgi:hypothetical protein